MSNVEKRKIVLVGTGLVGMSFAYSLLSINGIDELVLLDLDSEKALGEAMDMAHGLPYAQSRMHIHAGTYEDCKDASIVVVTAGAAQKPNQSRLELTALNTKIMRGICGEIKKSGFEGILIIASNPVDLMTYVAQKVTGYDHHRVIGTGTLLDTARLRYMVANYFDVSSKDVHAYIMGEHGDSSFVSWMHAYIGCKPLLSLIDEQGKDLHDLLDIYENVRDAAYEIIDRKKATYYGIGLSLNYLVQAILNNENRVLTLSVYQQGEYGQEGLYIGVPAIVNRDGIREIMTLPLNEVDQGKFDASSHRLKEIIADTIDPLL